MLNEVEEEKLKEPLISVIIPAYNAEKTIENTLQSVCLSTWRNLEIICVDDGSTDSTYHVISHYDDTRVIPLFQENKGVSVARNTGIDNSHGAYITFVDADDMVSPEMIAILFKMICISPDVDIASCSFTTESFDKLDSSKRRVLKSSKEAFDEHCFKTYIWGKLYKKSFIGKTRFAEGVNFGEDKVFLTELKGKCRKACVSDSKLYFYYQNPFSITHQKKVYEF